MAIPYSRTSCETVVNFSRSGNRGAYPMFRYPTVGSPSGQTHFTKLVVQGFHRRIVLSKPSVTKKLMPAVGIMVSSDHGGCCRGWRRPAGPAERRNCAADHGCGFAFSRTAARAQRGAARPGPRQSGRSSLAFEANQGQTDPQVKYMARGNGYTVFLTGNDTVFALQLLRR